MNPLNVIRHPKVTVKHYLNTPNIGLGVVLVVLPILLFLGVMLVAGVQLNLVNLVLSLIQALLFWIIAGAVIYGFSYALKGKEVSGKLKGILTAISLAHLVALVAGIIILILVLIAIPTFFSDMAFLSEVEATSAETALYFSEIIGEGLLAVVIGFLAAVISFLSVLWIFWVFYQAIALSAKGTILKNIVVLVLTLGILLFISTLIGF